MWNGKATIILLKIGLIKKAVWVWKVTHYANKTKQKKNKKKKTDLKIAKGVDTSLLKRNNLANLMLIN